MDNDDIDNLLNRWYDAKQQISELEKKIEKYKTFAEKFMDSKQIDSISNDKFTLQRKEMNRTSLGKKDLPPEIWDRYAKESFFNAFYISKKKDKITLKKSIKKKKI